MLADGTSFVPLGSAQDHKRIFDDDRGPNTGGMGAFAPSPLITADVERRVIDEIVRPVLERDGSTKGIRTADFLYVGLMLTADGPKVIEFNVRFGDPEAQVVLPMLDEDLSWLLGDAATGALPSRAARFLHRAHVGVVLAAGGYPEASKPASRSPASSRRRGAECARVSCGHEQARRPDRDGGRPRAHRRRPRPDITATRSTRAYRAASHIRFDGMQFRRDIGRKALTRSSEVLDHHVRLPGQSGRFARDRARLHSRGAVEHRRRTPISSS